MKPTILALLISLTLATACEPPEESEATLHIEHRPWTVECIGVVQADDLKQQCCTRDRLLHLFDCRVGDYPEDDSSDVWEEAIKRDQNR